MGWGGSVNSERGWHGYFDRCMLMQWWMELIELKPLEWIRWNEMKWDNRKSVETVKPDTAAAVCMGYGGIISSGCKEFDEDTLTWVC